jgi:hypothetical protein
MGEHKRIRIETDRATYPVGGQVMLYANLLDDNFEPLSQPGFEVEVSALGGDGSASTAQRVTLRPDVSIPGLYEGYFSPSRAGGYLVAANASDRTIANATEFQVADIKPELASTDMQLDRLRRIADLSGGACLSTLGLQKLPSLLTSEPHAVTIRTQHPLWDMGLIVWLLAVLVGFEWIMRRKYDLP